MTQISSPLVNTDKNPSLMNKSIMKDCYIQNADFGNAKINEIAMFGSHDACSYGITRASKPNTLEPDNPVNNSGIYNFGRGLLVRFSRAQVDNLTTQLNYGARYLDFSVTYQQNTFITSHGLLADPLKDNLIQVINFLEDNPGEFVIVYFLHLFLQSGMTYNDFWDYVAKVKSDKGNTIYDFVNYKDKLNLGVSGLTYNDVTLNGTKGAAILVTCNLKESFKPAIYSTYSQNFVNIMDHNSTMYSAHEATTYCEKNFVTLDNHIQNIKNGGHEKQIRLNQTQLAPTKDEIWGSMWCGSLCALAVKNNKYLLSQKLDWVKESFRYAPIYSTDFTTSFNDNFVPTISRLVREFNNALH